MITETTRRALESQPTVTLRRLAEQFMHGSDDMARRMRAAILEILATRPMVGLGMAA